MPGIDDSKCVLVTGATSGIGGALARAIASLPSHPRVIGAGRREDRLEELSKEGFATVQVDLDTDKDSLKKFVTDLLKNYPDVRLAHLNAVCCFAYPFSVRHCGALCGYPARI